MILAAKEHSGLFLPASDSIGKVELNSQGLCGIIGRASTVAHARHLLVSHGPQRVNVDQSVTTMPTLHLENRRHTSGQASHRSLDAAQSDVDCAVVAGPYRCHKFLNHLVSAWKAECSTAETAEHWVCRLTAFTIGTIAMQEGVSTIIISSTGGVVAMVPESWTCLRQRAA